MKEEERFKEFEILLPEISDEEIISTLFPHLFDNNQNLSENLEEINTNNVNKELNNENLNKNEENIEENEINNIKEILQSQIINNKKLFSFSDFEIFIQQKLFHEEKFFRLIFFIYFTFTLILFIILFLFFLIYKKEIKRRKFFN